MARKPTTENDAKSRPKRLGRLSMGNLSLEDALRGAMQVPVPPAPAKGGRPKPRKKKGSGAKPKP